jgi:hypothetical protein
MHSVAAYVIFVLVVFAPCIVTIAVHDPDDQG